jgi:hypothetical protein
MQKHVAIVGDKRNAYWVLVGPISKEIFLFEVLGVDERIILKWVIRESILGFGGANPEGSISV